MRITVIILLSLFLTAVLADDKCKNHKAYLQAKAFLSDLANGHSKEALDKANKFASYFENKSPSSSASSDDLGVCSQSGSYQGHQSCCDAQITKFLEKAALFKVKPLQNQNNIVNKLLNTLVKTINKSKCAAKTGVTKPSTANDLISNTALTNLQALIKNHKTCKVKFATVMVQFTRGAVCTVCAGIDQLSSLFDADGKLIISQSSSDQFQTAVTTALQCFKDLVSWSGTGGLQDIVNEVVAAYVDASCANVADISTKIQNIFTNNGGVKTSGVCQSTTVFSKQANCEGAQQGDSTIDSKADAGRFLQSMGFENIRVLQTADSTTSATGGVNILVTSTTDSTVDPDGNVDTTTNTPGSSVINSFLLSSLAALLLIIY